MKNRLSKLAIFILLISHCSFSQVQFGLRGGINIPWLIDDQYKYSPILGINTGMVVYTNMDNPFYFQTGLLYSVKGGQTNDFKSLAGGAVKLKYNVLEMPLNFGYQFGLKNDFKLAPYGGFYGGFSMLGRYVVTSKGTSDLFRRPSNKLIYNRIDAGLNMGLNFIIKYRWLVTGQFQVGLVNGYTGASEDNQLKHRVVSMSIDYLF